MARLVGARPSEVAILNTLTVNLHLLLASFFRPAGARRRILTDAPLFPSDRHALDSHLAFRGLDPDADLIVVGPRAGEDLVRIEDLEAAIAEHGPTLALALFDGVNFATGQALPVRRLTEAAHEAGAMVGWQLAHARRERAARPPRRRRRLRRLVHLQVPQRRPGLGRVDLRPRAPHAAGLRRSRG